ncbi:PhzF family phenazine biosynthesis protein [Halogeometricum borinquense]|uniref:PhzF family phenazine biosynthesis protein n=1 Tax=Halogeometricum borinquense TaxID=60847 RepID=A0A6C0UDD2_9EURY|nr:PhzF family phenazine biosynthesis protein [Halogeometricum borinquense]QIB73325.1 PhzF family phenazine biosynthesis protein [Halogeometricum borinquense]QIQ77277.1 PhzF family phenazine biosynthesis protein [Halogeometricum borinquense]
MQTRRTLLVDAFATEPLSGNAAGVVPDGDLTESQMQSVASELAVSETAFVQSSGSADRRLRFFTPTREIDLCGHATIATHAHLYRDGVIDAGTHTVETNVGVLDVEVEADGIVWMTQESPTVESVDLDYARLGEALGIDPAAFRDVGEAVPPAVASTGLPFLVVPVNFLEHLGNADPNFTAVEKLTDEYDVAGLYVFTFDALEADTTLHARMFAPGIGIPEDPVTGTASGACGAYLRHVDAFDGELPEKMVFEQGHFLDRPGRVHVRVGTEVRVGGFAVTALDGSLSVPPAPDDDILEA